MDKKPKEKRPATLDIDWKTISSEYITSNTNINTAALAAKYNLPVTTVEKRCAKDGWVSKRKAYRDRVVKRAIKKTEDKEVNKMAHLMSAADLMGRHIDRILKDTKQFNKRIIERPDGELVEREFTKADTKALRDLTASIKDLTAVMQALYPKDDNETKTDSGGVIVLADVDAPSIEAVDDDEE